MTTPRTQTPVERRQQLERTVRWALDQQAPWLAERDRLRDAARADYRIEPWARDRWQIAASECWRLDALRINAELRLEQEFGLGGAA